MWEQRIRLSDKPMLGTRNEFELLTWVKRYPESTPATACGSDAISSGRTGRLAHATEKSHVPFESKEP